VAAANRRPGVEGKAAVSALPKSGSHRRYRVERSGVLASTAVAVHPGDIPPGTLRKIERHLEPVLGKKWLRQ
jgi:predicted RNA binding protein YcfA (HicA-like mRNA interferase family)